MAAPAGTLTEIFAAMARQVGEVVRADVVHIARYEHDGTAVALAGWAREGETLPAGASTPYSGRNVTGEVLRTGRPVRIDDYEQAFGSAAERVRSLGLRAAVGAPIVIGDRVWGVVVASSKGGPLPAGSEERIAECTELVASMLTRADAQERWQRLTHEPAALERVATLVARAVPAEELFSAVATEVGTLHGADRAAVVRYEDGRDATVLASWSAAGAAPEPVPDGVSAPIVVEGELWGAVSVHRSAPLPPDTGSRLSGFAELLAAAIANLRARRRARRLADEQAALRRVATLVARDRSADEVFHAIASEIRTLLGVEDARLARIDGDELEVVAMSGPDDQITAAGARLRLTDGLAVQVIRTGQPQRLDGEEIDAHATAVVRNRGYQTLVAVPLSVENRLWGVLVAGSRSMRLERGIEGRLTEFAELMGIAVANLQAREALAASRARLVEAADDERRRVVRDLHDGAQQRLVHAIVTLKLAQRSDDLEEIEALIGETLEQADQAIREMRELAHGIMPAALTRGGLRAAVEGLAKRAPLPVEVSVDVGRLPPPVEATAYFVIAEALTNVAKHAAARRAAVSARLDDDVLHVAVHDDGRGGASGIGSGLVGLADRVSAFAGALRIDSPANGGSRITASIPLPR